MRVRYGVIALVIFNLCIQSYNERQVKLLQQGQSDSSGVKYRDFRGLGTALKGHDFSGKQLSQAAFGKSSSASGTSPYGITSVAGQNSDLTGTKFQNCSLVSADFSNAILVGADFTGADISYANFSGSDLTGALLDNVAKDSNGNSTAQTAVFCGATMPDGTPCSGTSWESKSGDLLYCHCSKQS